VEEATTVDMPAPDLFRMRALAVARKLEINAERAVLRQYWGK
jgi:hypothetical protein